MPAPAPNESVAGTDGVHRWRRALNAGWRRIFIASGAVCGVPWEWSRSIVPGKELAHGRLEALAPARTLAQQTLATLRQNHRWALVYNLTAMPLAALGLVHPWLAAAGMSLSSVAVVLNSLRIGVRPASTHIPAEAVGTPGPTRAG